MAVTARVMIMKVGQGQLDTSQLIERMQKAHAEGPKTEGASSFQVAPDQEVTEAKPTSGVERRVLEIAERVIGGELDDPAAMRSEVLGAIVDERFSKLVEPAQRRRTLEMLEVTLGEDPSFQREVDDMLVLAARQLAQTPDAT